MSRLELLLLLTHEQAITAAHGRDLPLCEAPVVLPAIGDGYDSRRASVPARTSKAAYMREYRHRQALKRGTH
jgi:hypothetical protein